MEGLVRGGLIRGAFRWGAYKWQFTVSYKTTSGKFCHLCGK